MTWPCQLFKTGTHLIGLCLTHAGCFNYHSWPKVVSRKCDKRPQTRYLLTWFASTALGPGQQHTGALNLASV